MDEYLEILDENGNRTGEKDTRENIHKKGLLHSEVAIKYIRNNILVN